MVVSLPGNPTTGNDNDSMFADNNYDDTQGQQTRNRMPGTLKVAASRVVKGT